ncbi:hypothetical protein HU200_063942 [Digitaria exilis]|uniref:RING-type E3 ubiquitin transferase n=1 Tax=Digitaria exilis TaxID=1010633 RepID=A0A835AAM0_9POAL|nr:hypothetical protein HU200_063942 [Digitaria exilis]
MGIMDVAEGKPEQCTSEQGSAFEVKDNLFRGCILGVIAPHLINPLLKKKTGKEMWDALDAQYGVSDAGSELYLMEQFLDYRMVEDRPVVEQANELHVLAKDLGCCNKENPCVLPDKFVAGGIISKLPPSWRDFATSLKHRRQEFTIDGLIGTLDVEEKARAKDVRNKGTPVGASANFVQKNINARTNNKGKGKKPPQPQNPGKTKQTAGFKKKKGACYVCGSEDHFAGKCPQRKEGKDLPVLVMETEDAFLESITSPPSSAVNLPPHRRRCAHTTGESRFLGSVSTRLLAQNCYVFTGVRFTVLGTPPPSNDYTAPRLLPARLRRSDCTASTDLPASNLYDYFEQGQESHGGRPRHALINTEWPAMPETTAELWVIAIGTTLFVAVVLATKRSWCDQPPPPERQRRNLTPEQSQRAALAALAALQPPVAAAAVLPRFLYAQGRASETLVCAICLEALRDGELCSEVPGCRHVFHGDCVGAWATRNGSCPLCREKIVKGLGGAAIAVADDMFPSLSAAGDNKAPRAEERAGGGVHLTISDNNNNVADGGRDLRRGGDRADLIHLHRLLLHHMATGGSPRERAAGAASSAGGPAAAEAPAPPQPARAAERGGSEGAGGAGELPVRGGAGTTTEPPAACAICLDELRQGQLCSEAPACRHIFHEGCIRVWAKSKNTCPLCRARLVLPRSGVRLDGGGGGASIIHVAKAFTSRSPAGDSTYVALAAGGISTEVVMATDVPDWYGLFLIALMFVLCGIDKIKRRRSKCGKRWRRGRRQRWPPPLLMPLPYFPYAGGASSETVVCSICLETLRQWQLCSEVPEECLGEWVRSSGTCPLCRAKIVPGSGMRRLIKRRQQRGERRCRTLDDGSLGAPVVLPHFPYAQQAVAEPAACAICLDELRHGELCSEVPACRHIFHESCIRAWTKKMNSCPLCRAKIVPGGAPAAADGMTSLAAHRSRGRSMPIPARASPSTGCRRETSCSAFSTFLLMLYAICSDQPASAEGDVEGRQQQRFPIAVWPPGTVPASPPPPPALAAPVPPVAALPYFPYAARGGIIGGGRQASETVVVCAICLDPLRHGQPCSEVPACRHTFHRDCVGVWVRSSNSCPLCRVKIVPRSGAAAVARDMHGVVARETGRM